MQRLHDRPLHRRRELVNEGRLQTELVQICRNGLEVVRFGEVLCITTGLNWAGVHVFKAFGKAFRGIRIGTQM